MQWCNFPDPLIVILGPTAVGKTELSIRLAEALNGEIISADSRLFYRGMDIGTAKPTRAEMLRVPHHLIDVCDPDETWSLAVFQRAAQEAIRDIHSRNKLPLLVGGTGQYVRAVIEGWQIPAQQPDPRLRQALEKWAVEIGPDEMHRRLALIDPVAAGRILPGNVRRTIRALEVIFNTGRRFDEQRTKGGSPFSLLMLGLKRPRAEIYARVDARIEAMLKDGMLDEVRGLLAKGYSADLPSMSAIGYREMTDVVQGKMTLDEAVTEMKSLTHQFVRRQANWFKETDPDIHWFNAAEDCLPQMITLIQSGQGWLPRSRTEE
ncbi:tRNA dimethylallyltransferase [Longilinea arvoryzae]|uniref:tRNA dimethylallyltransferase n=2 Tax=Longilinea arvoryzae TaxID=360412 RepID=A0A0S7BHD1_9CHLR|nr:tRNA dimethylallyltransferase [Longilinea arvoryzae]